MHLPPGDALAKGLSLQPSEYPIPHGAFSVLSTSEPLWEHDLPRHLAVFHRLPRCAQRLEHSLHGPDCASAACISACRLIKLSPLPGDEYGHKARLKNIPTPRSLDFVCVVSKTSPGILPLRDGPRAAGPRWPQEVSNDPEAGNEASGRVREVPVPLRTLLLGSAARDAPPAPDPSQPCSQPSLRALSPSHNVSPDPPAKRGRPGSSGTAACLLRGPGAGPRGARGPPRLRPGVAGILTGTEE